jgi:hypothetical protein
MRVTILSTQNLYITTSVAQPCPNAGGRRAIFRTPSRAQSVPIWCPTRARLISITRRTDYCLLCPSPRTSHIVLESRYLAGTDHSTARL